MRKKIEFPSCQARKLKALEKYYLIMEGWANFLAMD